MDKFRGIVLALCIAAALTSSPPPGPAAEKTDGGKTLFDEGEDTGQRRRRGFELSDEETNRILEALKKRDPKKAREVESLRKKDPERFMDELRRHATEELDKLIDERREKWRQKWQAAFLEWLEKNLHDESKELLRLKDADPNVYNRKYDLVSRKYYRIFEVSRRNPEWAEVLLEDLKLQKREDELVARIKSTKHNKEQEDKLANELEEVVALRYDVILRRRQIAYEWLLKRLEDLRNEIRKSREEMIKYRQPNIKEENVKQRIKDLLEEKKRFWD